MFLAETTKKESKYNTYELCFSKYFLMIIWYILICYKHYVYIIHIISKYSESKCNFI